VATITPTWANTGQVGGRLLDLLIAIDDHRATSIPANHQ
jgi:hypothetical protein